jgi:hypothetical protein
MTSKYIRLFLMISIFITPFVYGEEGPRVEMFSPQGTIKNVRQVLVRFSEQMVPFGDLRGLPDPFDIDCPEKGIGRWADGKNWVYDFEKDLPAGVRCEFRLKPGLKTLSRKEITGQRIFAFSTGGPSIKNSIPYEGSTWVDEEQIFILTLDAEPEEGAVIQQVAFSVEGIQDHIGIRMIKGKEREEILKVRFRYRKPTTQPMVLI